MKSQADVSSADVVLIGGGVTSATLAALLTQLEPDWKIEIFERLDHVGLESSNAWNNAGTGHSALCELNYTPQDVEGGIDPAKAITINQQFQVSRQFWAHLVRSGMIGESASFISPVPHMSFVRGADSVEFLRRRYQALKDHPLFHGMQFTEDHEEFSQWAPLMAEGRPVTDYFAATRIDSGTDVDFGALTRELLSLAQSRNAQLHTRHNVDTMRKLSPTKWGVKVTDLETQKPRIVTAPFVFIGAGGGALRLLQESGIKEGRGFGGFPVSGQFLRCTNPDVVEQHNAKVYGKAAVGAPPMSVPHLDTRYVDGKKSLLFGPYAGFSPKFQKTGKFTDLPFSVRPDNLTPMLNVAKDNMDLTKYLVGEVLQSMNARMDALREFLPELDQNDWELITAGQRVQVIAKDPQRGGVLQFGTELVMAQDGSVAALLGASPGASTATSVMIDMLETSFASKFESWKPKLKEMIPSFGEDLTEDGDLARRVLAETADALGLVDP